MTSHDSHVKCAIISLMTDLLVGEDRWADEVSQSIFNHVLHQVGPEHFLIIDQERCLDLGKPPV